MTSAPPGNWCECDLGSISLILDNLRVPLSAAQRSGRSGPYPYCGANGVLDHIDDFMIDDDVILLAEDGGNFDQYASRPIAYRMQGRIWVNNHAHVLKATNGETEFLFYTLEHKDITPYISSGTRSKLTRGELVRIKVSTPKSICEQRKIGATLRDADNLISALELLITKKQAIKQGMMQELLTGRTRLPGFSMPWRTEALGAVSDIDPETIPSETSHSEMIDYVSLEDVSRGRILASSRVKFGNAPSRARRAVRPLDVIFGTVRPNLQSHALYRGGLRKPVVSTGFAVIRARSSLADPQFLFYLVMSSLTSSQVERIIAGSNYPAVSSRDVRIFEYLLPDITEQEAIGSALADAEAELTVLHARLQKARAIKQGMMQELLTGRSRLPVPEAVA